MKIKQVLHNCEQSAASFTSLLLDDFLLSWMQNPQGAQGTEPSPVSGCHLFSAWKERLQSERAGPGIQMEVLFHQALFLPLLPENAPLSLRPNTFPSSLQLHFQRKVSADKLYFISKARNPGRRNWSLKGKWNHPYIFVMLSIFLYILIKVVTGRKLNDYFLIFNLKMKSPF